MALKTLVKVGNINNLSDARYCAGMGVDLLGFNMDPKSEDFIGEENFYALTSWVEGIRTVGEFEKIDASDILAITDKFSLDLIQVSSFDLVSELKESEAEIICQVSSDQLSEIKVAVDLSTDKPDYLLITGSNSFMIEQEETLLKEISEQIPVILGFGFDSDNVNDVLNKIDPAGLAMYGGHEERPGWKDFDELADVLEVLEIED